MHYAIVLFWVLGVSCVVRGASLWSAPLAWVLTGLAFLAMMAWTLGQSERVK